MLLSTKRSNLCFEKYVLTLSFRKTLSFYLTSFYLVFVICALRRFCAPHPSNIYYINDKYQINNINSQISSIIEEGI